MTPAGSGGFRRRLALWYTSTLALLLLVFAVQSYWIARTTLLEELDLRLDDDAALVAWIIAADPNLLDELASGDLNPHFAIEGSSQRVYTSAAWSETGLETAPQPPAGSSIFWTNEDGDSFRVRHLATRGGGIMVARDAAAVRTGLRGLALMLAIGLPSTLAVAVLGGFLLADRALRPVRELTRKAREITADRLSDRISVHNPSDEFGQLALVFNDTLARLEDSFGQLRRFTADASHQLRTPLAAMRAVGEAGLSPSSGTAELRDAIASMLEETDRLSRLVDSLLLLTRADAGQLALKPEVLELAGLVAEVVELLGPLAEEKRIAIVISAPDAPIRVRVDPSMARQVLINVIENAIKYSPSDTTITVATSAPGPACVVVEDQGAGLPPGDPLLLFERFHRGESGGSTQQPGGGLGLSVARWAAQVDGGTITAENAPEGGARFTIQYPVHSA